jgi:ribosomal protein S18 acetylase RimI-like enzyme
MKTNLYIEIPESLTPDQLKMMCELEKDAFPEDGAVDELFLVPLVRNGRIILLREKGDDRPIAVCELIRDYKQPEMAYIFGYYVRSDKQGHGYGKTFMADVIDLVRKDDFKKLCLTVKPENISAVKLYEKIGFEVVERRKSEYGAGSDRYFMIKVL